MFIAHILRQCTVVRDGLHNAFTDLIHWQGAYWASYRKGAGHVSADGQTTIALSADRQRWREVASLHVPGDNRDPKLVVLGDRLACCFPTWEGGHVRRRLQQFVSFSENGFIWSKPQPILEPYWWLWRVVPFHGRYFGAAYTYNNAGLGPDRTYRTEWVVSDDMLRWDRVAAVGTNEHGLGEAGFHFFPDGEVWMVSRRASPTTARAYFAVSKPPYTDWQLVELDRAIQSPAMIEYRDEIFVAGRRLAQIEGDNTFPFADKWSLGVWRVTFGKVEPVLHIPATGDCGYPGFIVDPEGRVCLSYYSQHAYHMGVHPEPSRRNAVTPGSADLLSAADVFFAELDLTSGVAKP